MTIQHKNIADADLHEPKGIASAPANKVYVSNGAGSGSWEALPSKLYAEMYIDAGVTSQTLSSVNNYTRLNPTGEWTQGIVSGLSTTPANGTITLTSAGTYLVEFWVVFITSAVTSGSTYSFKYAINTTPGPRILSAMKPTNGSDRLHVSAQGLVTVNENDTLSMYVSGDIYSQNTTITVVEAGLIAIKLAD